MAASRSLRGSTPPLKPSGDPPAATHAPHPRPGDPPAAPLAPSASPGSASRTPRGQHIPQAEDALDLHYCGSGSSAASPIDEVTTKQDSKKSTENRGKAIAQDSGDGRSQLRPDAANLGSKQVSYKEALMGVRTFKPRFDSARGPEEWRENAGRQHRTRATVWSRLGERVDEGRPNNGFLQLLKEKAVGRCFNCFARDHRIAVCRDPPRCVLCSRSGHKARLCPSQIHRITPTTPSAWKSQKVDNAGQASVDALPMALIPGDPSMRPSRVAACAARTAELREAERDLMLRGLIAVQRDASAQLTCAGVLRDALQQLRIPGHALQVTRISTTKFLLRFETPELRNAACARGTLSDGFSSLHLMPWGRQAGAFDGSLPHRARVCLEGVPGHAHQIETVMHMLPKRSFVESIDYERKKEDELGCFILWIWCKDADALAVQGTLEIEEPFFPPEGHCSGPESSQMAILRSDELAVLKYDVLIHLDCVEDYSPPPTNPSNGSSNSGASGLPSDVPMVQWPARQSFVWHLGQPDVLPDPPRLSVHSRLGARRDRSPPRGSGHEGGGFRHMPPNQFDLSRFPSGGAGTSTHRGHAAGGYTGRHRGLDGDSETTRKFMWKKKEIVHESEFVPNNAKHGQESDVLLNAILSTNMSGPGLDIVDPMLEECAEQVLLPSIATDLSGDVGEQPQGLPEEGEVMPIGYNAKQDQQDCESTEEFSVQFGKETGEHTMLHKEKISDLQAQAQESADFPFDLNLLFENPEEDALQEAQLNQDGAELCLRAVEELTLDVTTTASEGPNTPRHRKHAKGLARLVVPLKKSLLCNPTPRPKAQHGKKAAAEPPVTPGGKNTKGGSKGTVEEQAAVFLIRNSGIVNATGHIKDSDQQHFGEQFFKPIQDTLVGNMRSAFGLPSEGQLDSLGALAIDAEA
ncbi:unnamed protein product [Urochloa decumbens]|uniref:CCHC-type domain-containing protein n=1 Tax=Urochloa decumbens TaxID=240449 RepID=A0ABC8ZRK0_9POAL